MSSASFWDERYGGGGGGGGDDGGGDEEYAYGTDPNDFLVSVADRIPTKGRVLCLAEGEGRNAVYLAGRGHSVTAVDSSQCGLDRANKLATKRGVTIDTVCADLAEFKVEKEDPGYYDAVVAIFCHLPPPLRRKVHADCAAALRPGGVFLLEAYTPRQVGRGTGGPPSAGPMMTCDILREDLAGVEAGMEMEILRECDRDVREGKYHTGLGSVVQMVARKGGGGGGASSESSTLSEMPLLSITSPETVEMCKSLPLCDGDVFICSYPKSGTTWTQHIVLSLLMRHRRNDAGEPLTYDHVSDYAPFFEVDQHWNSDDRDMIDSIRQNHARLGRRVFNTHLRWDMLPVGPGATAESTPDVPSNRARFIYLVRSPLDVCVSFYYHLSHQEEGRYEGSFEEFFSEWIDGKIAFGSWIDHILSFAPALARNDVLFVSYEEMLSDTRGVVAKMAHFLSVNVTDEDMDEMLPSFTFESMKSDLDRFQPRSVTWRNDFKFLRRGISGDSQTVATDEQREALRGWFERENLEGRLKRILSTEADSDALETLLALIS